MVGVIPFDSTPFNCSTAAIGSTSTAPPVEAYSSPGTIILSRDQSIKPISQCAALSSEVVQELHQALEPPGRGAFTDISDAKEKAFFIRDKGSNLPPKVQNIAGRITDWTDFQLARSPPPSPGLPISLSVQRQGTRSRHWLDFHTVPSTERHIKLIRVNNCGGALLSRAPIGLAWTGSGDTDGLVISVLGAEGTDEYVVGVWWWSGHN
ncbi:Hypothetical predicted protein [Scomber scombrus]|uniref:Fucose-specific lectin n=1 Tax=Scomber scombrus TaxID=13677 RepID=A0AAV1PE75_SCOSC